MVDTVTNVVGAKEFLEQNPEAGTQFDLRYGEGAAYAILNNEYVTPEETAFCILDAPTSYIKKPT